MRQQKREKMNEREILEKIKKAYSEILKENMVGIYVHGSIAFRCFNWDKSDIDFIVVAKRPLALSEKEALIRVILSLDPVCPPKGIEMSVVLAEVCRPFVYPTPYELHFSNAHKQRYQENLSGYCEKLQGVDMDLAAHFTMIRACGMPLIGPNVSEVFGEVPKDAYLDSIRNDIAEAETEIMENPVYMILNLCRVLAYIREALVLSKAQGGDWGMENLPQNFRPVVAAALESYCGSKAWEECCRSNGVFENEPGCLHEFARYMLHEITVL